MITLPLLPVVVVIWVLLIVSTIVQPASPGSPGSFTPLAFRSLNFIPEMEPGWSAIEALST